MKKKLFVIIASIILLFILSYFMFIKGTSSETTFTYGQITTGNLDITITSTGTLEAISTVEVGTQVSGKISQLLADFNSEVKKGQLLAVLDTTTLAAQVRDAEANLLKAKADYSQKTAIHEINKKLYDKNFLSELDFVKSKTDVETTQASLKSAESALERAKTNLDYAYIYSPITGKIINRSIEQGQTVAASFSSPTLFTIAEDLSRMRIMANVDESDIGQIKQNQKVKFTVQTYTDKTFQGTVSQIRLHSSVVSNVVNYTVVITADNNDGLLLPGMTATVDFYINHKENVLLVPNTALRVQPGETLQEEIQKNMKEEMDNINNKMKSITQNGTPPPMPNMDQLAQLKNKMKRIYYFDKNNKLKDAPLIIGLTDGKNTEIVEGRNITSGMKIITGITEESTTTTTTKSNALSPSSQQSGPPPPPMM